MLPRMEEASNASTRAAVALVTAWLADPVGEPRFPTRTMIDLIGDLGQGDDVEGLVDLVVGATALSARLLERIEEETGVSVKQSLREVALDYA